LRGLLASMLQWFAKDRVNAHLTACVDVNPLG
jgi:hypothetical protein